MFTGPEIVETLVALQVTHVVWVPDSTTGPWEPFLEAAPTLDLVRVCREGEAWPLAAGLQLGGQSPLIVMQSTGLFESGDALRNVLFDLKLPLFAMIGARNWLTENSHDSAKRFTQPILDAWDLDYVVIGTPADKSKFSQHFHNCRQAGKAGAVVLAEGRG